MLAAAAFHAGCAIDEVVVCARELETAGEVEPEGSKMAGESHGNGTGIDTGFGAGFGGEDGEFDGGFDAEGDEFDGGSVIVELEDGSVVVEPGDNGAEVPMPTAACAYSLPGEIHEKHLRGCPFPGRARGGPRVAVRGMRCALRRRRGRLLAR